MQVDISLVFFFLSLSRSLVWMKNENDKNNHRQPATAQPNK